MTKQQPSVREEKGVRGADNRRRLVYAGYEVLSEKGFEAMTVKEIARVAGVSPGLFHYYFASKDELLLAVLGEAGERFKERVMRQAGSGGMAPRDRIERAVRFIEEAARREPELFRMRYELFALGLRNPEFLPMVGEQLACSKAEMARILGEWFPEAHEARVGALAAIILACFDGFALQQIARPESDLAPARDLLRELMEAELAQPRDRRTPEER